jgi:hypothetical protein
MKTSEIITFDYLRSQSIELLGWSLGYGSGGFQLSFANRMYDFNARNRTAGRPKRFLVLTVFVVTTASRLSRKQSSSSATSSGDSESH